MKTTVFALMLLMLMSGCDGARSKADAVNSLMKLCNGNPRVTAQVGGWNEYLRVECEVNRDALASPAK